MTITNIQGTRALWRKETTATPRGSNITTWKDPEYHGTGEFGFLDTHPGRLLPPEKVGGAISVTSQFDAPLPKGKPITRSITIECINCFCDDEEEFSWIPTHRFDEMTIRIEVPKSRPFKGMPRGLCSYGTKTTETPGIAMNPTATMIDLSIRKPRVGAEYKIVWRW